MSVIVATAYMEEAERFDWLIAMDAGRIMAGGSPARDARRAPARATWRTPSSRCCRRQVRGRQRVRDPAARADRGRPPAIEAEGLTQQFGDFTAVDHVSFRIERGEIFGFLGSNGCGKTTTMKMLTGLLPPSEGEASCSARRSTRSDIETRACGSATCPRPSRSTAS